MASTQYYKDKVQLLMVELALSQCGEYARRQYEDRINCLEGQLLVATQETEEMAAMAAFWADAYRKLATTGIKQDFEAYNGNGFSTGKIMPNRKRPGKSL